MSYASRTLLVASLVAACAGKTERTPWLVPEVRFASVDRIALFSVGLPRDLENPDPVRALFDSLLTDELVAVGYEIVPSAVADSFWGMLLDSAGGLYDPKTGERDTSKANGLVRRLGTFLAEQHGAQAILYPDVISVPVQFSESHASWDGQSQDLESVFTMLVRAVANEPGKFGTVHAYSLKVEITDVDGKPWFSNQGGIEVWERPRGKRYEQVPREKLFDEPGRNREAVRLALGSLVKKRKARPADSTVTQPQSFESGAF